MVKGVVVITAPFIFVYVGDKRKEKGIVKSVYYIFDCAVEERENRGIRFWIYDCKEEGITINTPGVEVRLEVPRQVAAKNSFRAVYNNNS